MSLSAAAPARAREARISVPIAVGLTVLVATAVHVALSARLPAPWILPDELRYAELARSLADGRLPAIRDEATFGFGLGYPLLLAPIWAIFDDASLAYAAAKVLNSVLLGLTAVPAYFLARRFVMERLALVAAALSVTVPSLLYAGMLMTEAALYPAFALALLAIASALERPTPATQLAALGSIALASSVKVLAVALLLGYLVAIPLFHRLDTPGKQEWLARLRTYRPTGLALAALAVVASLVGAALGRGPTAVLGTYEPFLWATDWLAVPAWMFQHLAVFDLSVAVMPFAAAMLVVGSGLRRGADREARLLAVMLLTMAAPVFVAVAAYSSNAGPAISGYASGAGANERATFMLAPLAFIALVVWLRDRTGSRAVLVAVALCAGLLPAAVPLDRFAQNVVSVQAFSLIPWVDASGTTHGATGLIAASLALGTLFAVLASARARDVAFVLPVAAALVVVTMLAHTRIALVSEWSRAAGLGGSPGWIDRAVGQESVSVLWYERQGQPWAPHTERHRIVWLNEFFNRSVGDVYGVGSPIPYGVDLPSTPVRVEDDGRVVLDDGAAAPLGPLVLVPCYVGVDGATVARDAATGATVYRVRGAVRVRLSEPRDCSAASS